MTSLLVLLTLAPARATEPLYVLGGGSSRFALTREAHGLTLVTDGHRYVVRADGCAKAPVERFLKRVDQNFAQLPVTRETRAPAFIRHAGETRALSDPRPGTPTLKFFRGLTSSFLALRERVRATCP